MLKYSTDCLESLERFSAVVRCVPNSVRLNTVDILAPKTESLRLATEGTPVVLVWQCFCAAGQANLPFQFSLNHNPAFARLFSSGTDSYDIEAFRPTEVDVRSMRGAIVPPSLGIEPLLQQGSKARTSVNSEIESQYVQHRDEIVHCLNCRAVRLH
jgi:hypothetical protein